MIRFRVFLGTTLALGAIIATFVHAQTDEEKKKAGGPQSPRRNARDHFAVAERDPVADSETKTGHEKSETEKEPDAKVQSEGKTEANRNSRTD